ncbi:MAG TPA: ATP-binding protein [Terriglobales bacterium]|nr:ATP-binding protein [Terriglobales bacterium]
MNRRSLRFRVISWYAGIFTASFLFFGAGIYAGLRSYLMWNLRSSLAADARSIGEKLLDDAAARGNGYVTEEIEESFAPEVNSRLIRVTRNDGSVVYQSAPPADHSFDPSRIVGVPIQQWLHANSGFSWEVETSSLPVFVYSYPYRAQDGWSYLIEIGTTHQQIRSTLNGLLLLFGIGLPVMLAAACLGGFIVMKKALVPVRIITETAEQISLLRAEERLPVAPTGDELEHLSRALNRMLDRLEDAFQHIRRFSADVSHELRTPLTIIRGELESLMRHSSPASRVQEIAGNCLEEVERLTRIIDQLLALSRLDAGDDSLPKEVIDLGELVKSTADQMQLMVEEKGLALVSKLQADVLVQGNPSRFKQIVVNLLDNAIKYTPEGGTIEVTVGSDGPKAFLEISDSGIGIPHEALPHIFDRFYRVDKARSRETGGSGLGLSIVKSIAAAYGAEVKVTSSPGQGTRVRLEAARVWSEAATTGPKVETYVPAGWAAPR